MRVARRGELEADACVVAVPASVLTASRSSRPRRRAGGRAGGGPLRRGGQAVRAAAHAVRAERGDVRARALLDLDRDRRRRRPQPVVSAFAGSPAALAGLERRRGPRALARLARRLRPDLELDAGGALLSTWSDDPWAGAAYSTSPPPELAELSERPLGPLAFAGEHLGGAFAALMEGAIRSGRRAAPGARCGAPSGPGLSSPAWTERDLGRIAAFTDGVMAVAITLLVLNIEVPHARARARASATRWSTCSRAWAPTCSRSPWSAASGSSTTTCSRSCAASTGR